jgi:hypothetical protein
MANHDVRTYHWPPVIPDQRFSRNGMLPNAALMRRLADNFNWTANRQKKHIATYTQPLDAAVVSAASSVYFWPAYWRTGEATRKMRVSFGVIGSSAAPPSVTFTVLDVTGGGSTIDAGSDVIVTAEDSASVPSAIQHVTRTFDVSPNNEYQSYFQATTTLVYFSLAEEPNPLADDSLTAICNPGAFVAEGPIYDAHIQDLIDANNKLWRHNGSHLISFIGFHDFSLGGAATAYTAATASTSYVNVQDNSSTTVTDSVPGWKLYTQYHATANRTAIPVKFAVQVDRTAGTGTCDVKLTDGTNSISITGIGDNGNTTWATTTGTIPVQNGTKWDLHWKVSSGTTTFRMKGASLFTYEA